MPVDRRDLRKHLFTIASEQGGYFTAGQAKQVGYSYQAQAHHVGAGNWYRVDRALFRLAEWVSDVHDELARWTLWSKGRGVVSHTTALSVHGIGEFESARVHLTVPPEFTMHDPAVVLHKAELPAGDIVHHTGFRLTTPTRSLIDVAEGAPDEELLANAIEDAQQNGLVALRLLTDRAEAVDPRAALYIERAIRELASR